MKYIEVVITETARDSLKEGAHTFNHINKKFPDIKSFKEYLVERYGHIPPGRNKIYRDCNDKDHEVVGFLHSYWTRDWSHGKSKQYYQTDWIEFYWVRKSIKYFKL